MSEQKDPIAEQIAQEIKNQIEHDARDYAREQGTHTNPEITAHDYASGANAQDKIATNRTLDDIILFVKENSYRFFDIRIATMMEFIKELEKLKK